MTKEEAKKILDVIRSYYIGQAAITKNEYPKETIAGYSLVDIANACLLGSKALGQDLDKIRDEIADQRDFMLDCDGESDLGIALDIIDKYMESEEVAYWITEHPLDYLQPDEYKCSNCGGYYHKEVDECPYCKAKMRK